MANTFAYFVPPLHLLAILSLYIPIDSMHVHLRYFNFNFIGCRHNFLFVRLDGTLNQQQREKVLNKFAENTNILVRYFHFIHHNTLLIISCGHAFGVTLFITTGTSNVTEGWWCWNKPYGSN